MEAESLEQFVEDDVENILQLFNVFNKGTHGASGTFDLPQLGAVRKACGEWDHVPDRDHRRCLASSVAFVGEKSGRVSYRGLSSNGTEMYAKGVDRYLPEMRLRRIQE